MPTLSSISSTREANPAFLPFLTAILFVGLCRPAPAFAETPDDRPNVLFIAVDDLRPELQCYSTPGQPNRAITPNLDKLAASGIRFTRAYCNQAVCGASRLSLMTGLYPEFTNERTYHVTDWRKRWGSVVTLNQHFTANGYKTVGLGKIYHNTSGPAVDESNWTRWIRVSGQGYAKEENRQFIRRLSNVGPGSPSSKKRGPSTESAPDSDFEYSDGLRAQTAVRQIHELSSGQQPFFLAVGFTKPHLPFNAPTKYWNLYQRDEFELPSNRDIPPGYPQWARNRLASELRAYSDIPVEGTPAEFPDDLNKRLLHGYHACVSYTDHNIGMLLDALDGAGIAENTIVVFWADHGWKLGDHSSWCKHTNFECDTRVPLMIRWPKVETARGKSSALVELIDLYPTLCDLCEIEPPAHLQGKSLVPVIHDPGIKHRDFAYSSYPHSNWENKQRVVGHSIRGEKMRYTEWWTVKGDEVVARVATDLDADPGETTNLLPTQQEWAKQLAVELKRRVLAARVADLSK
ncbi:MAG: sulfatase [Planctomycetota bacterium]